MALLALPLLCFLALASCQWRTATLSAPRMNLACAATTNISIFAGGSNATQAIGTADVYDVRTNNWRLATLSAARSDLAAAGIKGGYEKIFFAGGTLVGGSFSAAVDIYDATTDNWTTSSLSKARTSLAAAACVQQDVIYFAGGYYSLPPYSDLVDVYDVMYRTWSTSFLGLGRYNLVGTTVASTVIFAGGIDGSASSSYGFDYFSCNTGTHSTNSGLVVRKALAAASTEKFSFFGGGIESATGKVVDAVTRFDVTTGISSTLNLLSEARSELAGVTVGNYVLFAGGRNANGTVSATVDILDTTTGFWYTSSLSQARAGLCATAVGTLAIFAGGDSGGPSVPIPSNVVDIFDSSLFVLPTTPSLTTTPPTPSPPSSPTPSSSISPSFTSSSAAVGLHVLCTIAVLTGAWIAV